MDPWCGAVLVDPFTALTAAHCVEDANPKAFSLGFGAMGTGPSYPVKEIVLHTSYRTDGPILWDMAVVRIGEPAYDIEPAFLSLREDEPVDVSLVSYEFVTVHGSGARHVFDGRADHASPAELSAVFPGADTNCHGEAGAGLFRRPSGGSADELLGIGSTGSYDAPHPIFPECVGRLLFAPISQSHAFLQYAGVMSSTAVR